MEMKAIIMGCWDYCKNETLKRSVVVIVEMPGRSKRFAENSFTLGNITAAWKHLNESYVGILGLPRTSKPFTGKQPTLQR